MVCVRVCDQVDNRCFCSLCRLVFQDISGRLPQVGFYTLCVRASVHPPRLQWLRAARHYWPSEIEMPSLSSSTNSLDSDMGGVAEGGGKNAKHFRKKQNQTAAGLICFFCKLSAVSNGSSGKGIEGYTFGQSLKNSIESDLCWHISFPLVCTHTHAVLNKFIRPPPNVWFIPQVPWINRICN